MSVGINEEILAHTIRKGENICKTETLKEHHEKVENFFYFLFEKNVIDGFFNTESETVEKFLRDVAVFHDLGKKSRGFQKKIRGTDTELDGSHSKYGLPLLFNEKFGDNECFLGVLGACLIAGHHSYLKDGYGRLLTLTESKSEKFGEWLLKNLKKFIEIKSQKNNGLLETINEIFEKNNINETNLTELMRFLKKRDNFSINESFKDVMEFMEPLFDFFTEYDENTDEYLFGSETKRDVFKNILSYKKSETKKTGKPLLGKRAKKESGSLHSGFNPYQKYVFARYAYSLLCASDSYATFSFYNNIKKPEEIDFGFADSDSFLQKADVFKREYLKLVENGKSGINLVRGKLSKLAYFNFTRAIEDKNIFFINAPTGAGKTLMSLNLMSAKKFKRIFYVFPFNTLIDQMAETLEKNGFEKGEDFQIINSVTGIEKNRDEDSYGESGILLYKEMFHTPIVLISSVGFFNILFGNGRNDAVNFWQLAESLVIIDEIQSIPIKMFSPFINVLAETGNMLNTKFVLMSATNPVEPFGNFLEGDNKNKTAVILDRHQKLAENEFMVEWNGKTERIRFKEEDFKYFTDRVNFERLRKGDCVYSFKDDKNIGLLRKDIENAFNKHDGEKNRVLIEFMTKKKAKRFFEESFNGFKGYKKYLLTGDVNKIYRNRILYDIQNAGKEEKILLVSTQVIEAGVDIDMDIGFKEESYFDKEIQFAGRINRNARKKNCRVFLFKTNTEVNNIYRNDVVNIQNAQKTVFQLENLRRYDLEGFYAFLNELISKRKKEIKCPVSEKEILFFEKVSKEMKLINDVSESVFVPFRIKLKESYPFEKRIILRIEELKKDYKNLFNFFSNGTIDGFCLFDEFYMVISDTEMNYSEKKVLLKNYSEFVSLFRFTVYENDKKTLLRFFDRKFVEKKYYVVDKNYSAGLIDEDTGVLDLKTDSLFL